MDDMSIKSRKLHIHEQIKNGSGRYLNPQDIALPPDYTIEVFAQGLDMPSSMAFTGNGDIIIAESGYFSGKPALLILREGQFEVISNDFVPPISGINYHDGKIYVSHLGKISVVNLDGTQKTIVDGLPSQGDFFNCRVCFDSNGKMYFGLGTCTNSGVVGTDNSWVYNHPLLCDSPGSYIMLKGQNFKTVNLFSGTGETISTGAYSPYGVTNLPFEIRKGILKASGSILKSDADGSDVELVAWGFRNPSYIRFDETNRLFVSNQGYDVRGSRPIANAPDEFHMVTPGLWYGWPDYAGGDPVTLNRFKSEEGAQPEFLILNHPNIPPRPFASFPPNSLIMGFDFNYNDKFGKYGDAYIAEFGSGTRIDRGKSAPYAGIGHRISKIDMNTGGVSIFAINNSGFPAAITREGGFGRPADVIFGPDEAMYIVDAGTNSPIDQSEYYQNTGVIWRIKHV